MSEASYPLFFDACNEDGDRVDVAAYVKAYGPEGAAAAKAALDRATAEVREALAQADGTAGGQA